MLIRKKKKPKKRSKKTENRELDEMWKEKVNQRDEYFCCICNRKLEGRSCNTHHILPKGIKGMRWEVNNGITLCPSHHRLGLYSAHLNAIWFTFWLKTNRSKQFDYIINKLRDMGREVP